MNARCRSKQYDGPVDSLMLLESQSKSAAVILVSFVGCRFGGYESELMFGFVRDSIR